MKGPKSTVGEVTLTGYKYHIPVEGEVHKMAYIHEPFWDIEVVWVVS